MKVDQEFEALVERARAAYELFTPEQKREHGRAQKVSFVLGNLRLAGSTATETQVTAAVDAIEVRNRIAKARRIIHAFADECEPVDAIRAAYWLEFGPPEEVRDAGTANDLDEGADDPKGHRPPTSARSWARTGVRAAWEAVGVACGFPMAPAGASVARRRAFVAKMGRRPLKDEEKG